MRFSKKKRINYSNKRLINLIGEDKNTLNLEAKNVQNIEYTLASEDNETSHILGIDEQGNAYINAKEEDLATFSILDNPYSLYWGSSSEIGDTGYSYKPITESLNITKGEVVEPLELKKLNKISYIFYNDRKEECGSYTIDVTVKGFDTPIRIIKDSKIPGIIDINISKYLENYLCIDIDNLKTFNLYLSHKNDNVSSEILFDASQVQNWDTVPEFYFDADSLLYIEPFVTAKFDEYLEYYKGEPVYSDIYKNLITGFSIFDCKNIKQVIPDDAEDSQYVQTYEFPYGFNRQDEVVVKKFANLSAVIMESNDYSNCTIHLADNKNTSLIIHNRNDSKYKPPYYENVDNAGDISLFITNEDYNVVNFNIDSDFNTEDETTLRIQQMPSITKNKLLNKITSLYLASNSLSIIRGSIPLKSLTLAITNELPERFQLGFIEEFNLKELNLSDSQFKNIPGNFSYNTLETLILNDTIESIGASAFDASYLNNIVLSKKLKKIGFRGFYNIGRVGNIASLDFRDTQLETLERESLYSSASLKIYLPTTVTNIANGAFGNNTTVYYKGTATGAPWGAKEVITEF